MFVKSNKVSDLKKYFNKKLELHFSPSEVKFMFNASLEKRLSLSPQELLFSDEMRLSESDLLFVRTIAHRLLENEPFQYIIGETEFYGLKLKTDSRALIPRPETEELVDWIKNSFEKTGEKFSILDFCTGSGCIALALDKTFPNGTIYATDVSEQALDLAKENNRLNQLNVSFHQHDILNEDVSFISDESLDCIVSNPPYIPEKDKLQMSENVLAFEPHLALFVSNENPLVFYQKIAEQGQIKLKKGGLLFFEIHENLAKDTKNLLSQLKYHSIEIKQDLQGKDRMIKAIK